ncbi:MAG: hypothetical protein JXA74_15490 [Anaerolineae bacterium]|nr:hypothetical protein [Anaerolineae bacterium]
MQATRKRHGTRFVGILMTAMVLSVLLATPAGATHAGVPAEVRGPSAVFLIGAGALVDGDHFGAAASAVTSYETVEGVFVSGLGGSGLRREHHELAASAVSASETWGNPSIPGEGTLAAQTHWDRAASAVSSIESSGEPFTPALTGLTQHEHHELAASAVAPFEW